MKCFNVKLIDSQNNEYNIGIMTSDKKSAMKSAEYSLFEGQHITAKAIDIVETSTI